MPPSKSASDLYMKAQRTYRRVYKVNDYQKLKIESQNYESTRTSIQFNIKLNTFQTIHYTYDILFQLLDSKLRMKKL